MAMDEQSQEKNTVLCRARQTQELAVKLQEVLLRDFDKAAYEQWVKSASDDTAQSSAPPNILDEVLGVQVETLNTLESVYKLITDNIKNKIQ